MALCVPTWALSPKMALIGCHEIIYAMGAAPSLTACSPGASPVFRMDYEISDARIGGLAYHLSVARKSGAHGGYGICEDV